MRKVRCYKMDNYEMIRANRNKLRNENKRLRQQLRVSWLIIVLVVILMIVIIIRMDTKVKKVMQMTMVTETTSVISDTITSESESETKVASAIPEQQSNRTVEVVDLVHREPLISESVLTDDMLWYDKYSFTDTSYQMSATAYDLSVQSCGKYPDDNGYGITRSGFDLSGMTGPEARCIAVDPEVIPLGSVVYVEFSDFWYKRYDGVYTAYDTGSGIKGNKIDIFMGDFEQIEPHQMTLDFGVADCKVTVLEAKDGE